MSGVLAWTGMTLLGAAGAFARFYLGSAVAAHWPSAFPFGTLFVNLTGGLVLGLLTGLSVTGDAALVAGTGLLGAYTTFSTWMVEAQRLGEDGAFPTMWVYLFGSMLLGLAATCIGWLCGEALG
jgi:CrcB protein